MKKFKKVLIMIIAILTVVLILGVLLVLKTKKEESIEIGNKELEITNQGEIEVVEEDEEIIATIEEQKTEEQLDNNEEANKSEIAKENFIKNDNVVNSSDTNKTIKEKNDTTKNVNKSKSVQSNNQNTQNNTQQQPQQTKQETKPVEQNKPVVTTPVRTYKENTTYISKLRNTITTTVRDNLSSLNKYGITSAEQYKIKEDSSICAYNGGNRNGWTYENSTAYNTFVKSILKGTSLKIYAVDEYQNGEYIQTLCYYGH